MTLPYDVSTRWETNVLSSKYLLGTLTDTWHRSFWIRWFLAPSSSPRIGIDVAGTAWICRSPTCRQSIHSHLSISEYKEFLSRFGKDLSMDTLHSDWRDGHDYAHLPCPWKSPSFSSRRPFFGVGVGNWESFSVCHLNRTNHPFEWPRVLCSLTNHRMAGKVFSRPYFSLENLRKSLKSFVWRKIRCPWVMIEMSPLSNRYPVDANEKERWVCVLCVDVVVEWLTRIHVLSMPASVVYFRLSWVSVRNPCFNQPTTTTMARSSEVFHFKILIIGESSVGKVWSVHDESSDDLCLPCL